MRRLRSVIALFLIALSAHSARAGTCFDDQNLAQLMPTRAEQRPVLIYVWSPRMVYSVQNMALASRAAAAAGMEFVVLHDGRVPPAELAHMQPPLEQVIAQLHAPIKIDANTDLATPPFVSPANFSQALCAKPLLQREALRHFPTAFVLTTKGIHAQPIVGAMPLAAWQLSLGERLKH